MLVIGLTGGIATGKSSVSKLFKDREIPVVDADIIARQVVLPGTRAYNQIVSTFGKDIILPDGYLDRPKLGAIVFNDEQKRKKLNDIVHPAVRREMLWQVVKCWMRGERVCVLDVPLLIESGIWNWVGKVVVVYCSAEIQLQRLMKRDNSSREAASSRLNSQLPITDKLEYADYVIDNSGGPKELEDQVSTFVRRLQNEVGWTWRLSLFPPIGLLSALFKLLWRRTNARMPGFRCEELRSLVLETHKIHHNVLELPSLVLGTALTVVAEWRPLACLEGGQPSRVTLGRNDQEIEVKGVPVAGAVHIHRMALISLRDVQYRDAGH
ncbi:CoaE-domain-containing protein [Stereum hirsutum FP-91666 SS1]|uniref:CoaE-domain-containing protein n=1 Tax=Stereum hirsutum (strain FP-91666) TaxID=721885 RepID=UPI0004409F1A|nr:CoaE-domain-containing protein [Stereum hirsutum FP-91666 SS1]EIM89637.1 CoaE-domain-containing protein [Stereum hirsutum FP-91666 SS1]